MTLHADFDLFTLAATMAALRDKGLMKNTKGNPHKFSFIMNGVFDNGVIRSGA